MLASDFLLWHLPLNNGGPVPAGPQGDTGCACDLTALDLWAEKIANATGDPRTRWWHLPADLLHEITQSWTAILNPAMSVDPVQGVIETLPAAWVTDVAIAR